MVFGEGSDEEGREGMSEWVCVWEWEREGERDPNWIDSTICYILDSINNLPTNQSRLN